MDNTSNKKLRAEKQLRKKLKKQKDQVLTMKTKINEIEFAFCNACTADCYICSKKHGGHNEPLMSLKVFKKAVEDLKEIDFNIIQTGGDGDSFLNNIYIDALRELRKTFPKKKIVLYSNFELFNSDRAEVILKENLLDEVNTRVDSLDPSMFEACTGLVCSDVFNNIDHFMKENAARSFPIQFNINYASIHHYKKICNEVLGKDPFYWRSFFSRSKEDEFDDVVKRFPLAKVSRIKLSLWAERNDPKIKCEPDMQCCRQHCFDSVLYIWTDGDVGICGYDDGQDALIYGNIMKETIADLWKSEARQKRIEMVRNREIKGYPCLNPKACLFY